MNINRFLLKDSSGKKSVTVTAFIIGFLVVNFKLLASGMTVGDFTMNPFTGVEYAAAIAALGAVYVMRRSNNKEETQE